MKKLIYLITLLVIFVLSSNTNAQPLAAERAFSLPVCEDITVKSCGYNFNGQPGNGTTTGINVPGQVSGLCPFIRKGQGWIQMLLFWIISSFPGSFRLLQAQGERKYRQSATTRLNASGKDN